MSTISIESVENYKPRWVQEFEECELDEEYGVGSYSQLI